MLKTVIAANWQPITEEITAVSLACHRADLAAAEENVAQAESASTVPEETLAKAIRVDHEATLAITAVRQSMKSARAENLSRCHGHAGAEDTSALPARGLTAASPAEELTTAPVVSAPSSSRYTVAAVAETVAARSGPHLGNNTPPPHEVQVGEPFRRSGDADFLDRGHGRGGQ